MKPDPPDKKLTKKQALKLYGTVEEQISRMRGIFEQMRLQNCAPPPEEQEKLIDLVIENNRRLED